MTALPTSVLIANRGEIAVRITATLRGMGIEAVAVHTEADAASPHVAAADRAVRIGSYLSVADVVAAAVTAGAAAIHPGYGFLSERAELARATLAAGLVWIGPPPGAIEAMGDKIRARATAEAAGVAVVPGRSGAGLDDDGVVAAALAVGLPVLLKPSAGGGGKGMHRVEDAAGLPAAVAAARREAATVFGDDTLLVERWVPRPRHIEVQVAADTHGQLIHLGDRECSLQRRHQKVVEEAPAPLLDADIRAAMAAAALAVARGCGYAGVGTVELIVSGDDSARWWFMEMNTRLQVEHPVTEMVTGVDLVEWQVRIAAGQPLPLTQDQVRTTGHAVEARIYAEDPVRGFLPSSGRVVLLAEPTGRPGIRVDSGLAPGVVVGTGFDPMLAKVVAWGQDRPTALARLRAALADTVILGVTTNVGFLRRLLARPEVEAGRLDTGLIERGGADLAPAPPGADDRAAVAAALLLAWRLEPPGPVVDLWDVPGGWRLGPPAPTRWDIRLGSTPVHLQLTGRAAGASVVVGDHRAVEAAVIGPDGDGGLLVRIGAETTTYRFATGDLSPDDLWLGHGGDTWRVASEVPGAVRAGGAGASGGPVRSPMPGTVLAVHVAVGDEVAAGARLVTVEAMKMEHVVTAPVAGTVTEMVAAGRTVALDQTLAVVAAAGPEEDP